MLDGYRAAKTIVSNEYATTACLEFGRKFMAMVWFYAVQPIDKWLGQGIGKYVYLICKWWENMVLIEEYWDSDGSWQAGTQWAETSNMNFNRDKCEILHLGWKKNQRYILHD